MTLYDYARHLMTTLRDPVSVLDELRDLLRRNSGYRQEVEELGLNALMERIRQSDNAAVRRGQVAPSLARTAAITVKAKRVEGGSGDQSVSEAHPKAVPASVAVSPAQSSLGKALRAASYPGRMAFWCESQEGRSRGLRMGDVIVMAQEDTRRIAKEELRVKSVRTATEYAGIMMWRTVLEWNEHRKRPLMESDLEAVELEARKSFASATRPQLLESQP